MSRSKLSLAICARLFLCTALQSVACASVPATQPAAFDLQASLDRYFSNLPEDWGAIAPAALEEQLRSAKPFLVDVREAKEVADAGYIATAINLPVRAFIKNLDKLPTKDQPIVVTCGSGHRSAFAMAALQLLGYANVKSLAGGLSAWKAAGLAVTTGAPPEGKKISAPNVDKDLFSALDNYFSTLPDGWSGIAPATLNDLLKSSQPFLLELREPNEIAGGLIAGSTRIPIRSLIKNLAKLPPDKGAAIIAVCATGHRSAMAMLALNLLGYNNVKSLSGGFNAWAKAGLPTSK